MRCSPRAERFGARLLDLRPDLRERSLILRAHIREGAHSAKSSSLGSYEESARFCGVMVGV